MIPPTSPCFTMADKVAPQPFARRHDVGRIVRLFLNQGWREAEVVDVPSPFYALAIYSMPAGRPTLVRVCYDAQGRKAFMHASAAERNAWEPIVLSRWIDNLEDIMAEAPFRSHKYRAAARKASWIRDALVEATARVEAEEMAATAKRLADDKAAADALVADAQVVKAAGGSVIDACVATAVAKGWDESYTHDVCAVLNIDSARVRINVAYAREHVTA